MCQPVDVPSGCSAELRLYLAAGSGGQCDGFLRIVSVHTDFLGGDVCFGSFHIQCSHHGRCVIGFDDDSTATGPVHDFEESGDGGFHHFLDVQGIAGIGYYVHEFRITAAIGYTLYIKMVFHRNGLFLHRVLVFALDDEERLVRILERISIEGTFRHSLIGFGQHQITTFGGGILDEAGGASGRIKSFQRARHHGRLVSSVAQRYAFDNQSRLGGFVVDVEAAHAAFEFDVHRGDVTQYLRSTASGHHQRGAQGGACCVQFLGEVALEDCGFRTFCFDGSGGGVGGHRCQGIDGGSVSLVERCTVCHAIQFQVGDAFQFRGEDGGFPVGSGTAQFEGLRCGVVLCGGFPRFQILVVSAVCGGGKHIDIQVVNLVFTLGSDGAGVFLRLSSATKYETDLFALRSTCGSVVNTQLVLATSCKQGQ